MYRQKAVVLWLLLLLLQSLGTVLLIGLLSLNFNSNGLLGVLVLLSVFLTWRNHCTCFSLTQSKLLCNAVSEILKSFSFSCLKNPVYNSGLSYFSPETYEKIHANFLDFAYVSVCMCAYFSITC
jgi:hypothetical protein